MLSMMAGVKIIEDDYVINSLGCVCSIFVEDVVLSIEEKCLSLHFRLMMRKYL